MIIRGNNKEYIFKKNIDKGYFIKQLIQYSIIMGYIVMHIAYGYSLSYIDTDYE
ncbi:MAG: hypothetical protein ACOZCL_07620 [Bacillota bacterium]